MTMPSDSLLLSAFPTTGTTGSTSDANTAVTAIRDTARPLSRASALKSAGFTLGPADIDAQDEASGTWTLTVPSASTLGDNFSYSLTNVGSGTVTVDGPGATNVSLAAGAVATVYVSNGHVYCALGAATAVS